MIRQEMVHRIFTGNGTVYECRMCGETFDGYEDVGVHCKLLHNTPHTAAKAVCEHCDFERHLIEETNEGGYERGIFRSLRKKAKSAKAGHLSHNPDHNVEILP